MAINIKELFVTDLGANSGSWWSNDKVDKINYNFYLLSNGGMAGPQGNIGADGEFGQIGPRGNNGNKGSIGHQGHQGAGILNEWDYFPETNDLPGYLFPKKNPINEPQITPVSLLIGLLHTYNPELNDNNVLASQIVNIPSDNSCVNLRVEDDYVDGTYGYNFGYNFGIEYDNGPKFNISPGNGEIDIFKINWIAQSITFKTNTENDDFIDSFFITDSKITISSNAESAFTLNNSIGTITTFEKDFKYSLNSGLNKILVSTNNQGDIEWKPIKNIFNTFPIGSIISIREEQFIADHFELNTEVNIESGSKLNNTYGRGKIDTEFDGWYLCNGETWKSQNSSANYLTPNLNNFSYNIDANGDAQQLKISVESEPILIGGYDIHISAVSDVTGTYLVKYTNEFPDNNTSPGISNINISSSGSKTHHVSRMIHIVYLEESNLIWRTD